jgi:hypothetical protein
VIAKNNPWGAPISAQANGGHPEFAQAAHYGKSAADAIIYWRDMWAAECRDHLATAKSAEALLKEREAQIVEQAKEFDELDSDLAALEHQSSMFIRQNAILTEALGNALGMQFAE